MNLSFIQRKKSLLFLSIIILFFTISPVNAQKSLEGESSVKKLPAAQTADNKTEDNLTKVVRDYFDNLFTKNYEEAVKSMPASSRGESNIAKIEKWREKFMSPADLKIINKQDNKDGTITATVTFNYTNPNGVKDIMREKIILTAGGGNYTIKSQPSLERQTAQPAVNNVAVSAGSNNVTPVTMTPNAPAMPDMSSLLSALSGGSGGSGAANVDPGELLGLMTELVNDADVMALSSNPKIMAIAKDPAIMSTLLSGNMTAIEANPKIKELLSDPAIRKIIEKVSSKRSGSSSQGGNNGAGSNPPSTTNGVDTDKIFE